MRSIERSLAARLAAVLIAQRGAVSRWQVMGEGGSDAFIRSQLSAGRWDRAAPGVYVLVGTPHTWERELWISLLAVGRHAVVSHDAAAALHGLLGFPRGNRVVTVAHSGHARVSGTCAHQISDLTPESRTSIDGLPVTTVARTFVDLAAHKRRIRLRMALDDARAANKVTLDQVASALGAVARQGKPGVRLLGSVLDELGPSTVPAASELERRLHDVVAQASLPALVPQYSFPGRQVVIGCVDGAWPDALLIVEADSRRWHTRVQDLARDHLRDQEAARAGWQVLRVMHEHLVADAGGTADMLRATRSMRLSQVA